MNNVIIYPGGKLKKRVGAYFRPFKLPFLCKWFRHKVKEIKYPGCNNVGFCKRCGLMERVDKRNPNFQFNSQALDESKR